MIRIRWEPPQALQDILQGSSLKVRDKVELVIAYYSQDHGGNAPSMKEIGDVLGISESRVCQIHTQLLKFLRRKFEDLGLDGTMEEG